MSNNPERYRATFYEKGLQRELLSIEDSEEENVISRSVIMLEDYRDARCVIRDAVNDREILTLSRCGVE